MKFDPDIHIVMHSILFLKPDVTYYSDVLWFSYRFLSFVWKKKTTTDYQRYTAYPENEGFKLHRKSTGGRVGLELSIIFERLHNNFLFWAAVRVITFMVGTQQGHKK